MAYETKAIGEEEKQQFGARSLDWTLRAGGTHAPTPCALVLT